MISNKLKRLLTLTSKIRKTLRRMRLYKFIMKKIKKWNKKIQIRYQKRASLPLKGLETSRILTSENDSTPCTLTTRLRCPRLLQMITVWMLSRRALRYYKIISMLKRYFRILIGQKILSKIFWKSNKKSSKKL